MTLFDLVKTGGLDEVKKVTTDGEDSNLKVRYKVTTIMRAETAECSKLFIDAGAQVNAKDDGDYTALQVAGMHRGLALIKVLVENGSAKGGTKQSRENHKKARRNTDC